MFTKPLFSPFGFFTAIVWNVASRILPERRFCYLWCERWKISSNLSKSKHLLSCANQPANHHHCHLQHWFGTFLCQKLYNEKNIVNAKKDKFQEQESWHHLDLQDEECSGNPKKKSLRIGDRFHLASGEREGNHVETKYNLKNERNTFEKFSRQGKIIGECEWGATLIGLNHEKCDDTLGKI